MSSIICRQCGQFRSSLDIESDGVCRQCKGKKSFFLTNTLLKDQWRKKDKKEKNDE